MDTRASPSALITTPTSTSQPSDGPPLEDTRQVADGSTKSNGKAPRKRGRRPIVQNEDERKARRKMQCKLNQRRYRARQQGIIESLSDETQTLGEELTELFVYRTFLSTFDQSRARTLDEANARPWLITRQFLRLFQDGFALHSTWLRDLQERFLHFATTTDFACQSASTNGVEALCTQMKRYTSYHAICHIDIASVQVENVVDLSEREQDMTSSFDLTGVFLLRISRDTVMLLYPHIVNDDELSLRIVGQEIHPSFRFSLHFGPTGRLTRLDLHVDFFSAFAQLLQSAQSANEILSKALISPLCELGPGPHDVVSAKRGESKRLSLKYILL